MHLAEFHEASFDMRSTENESGGDLLKATTLESGRSKDSSTFRRVGQERQP